MDIFKAFEKSMRRYDEIQKSRHWKKYDERKHLYNRESLENFRNNGLADGIQGCTSDEKFKNFFRDLSLLVGEDFISANLTSLNIGGCKNHFKIGDFYVDCDQLFSIKWLHDLETRVFSKKKISTICEIGGGYGSLAQKICSHTSCKYIMIDLPEANLLASYYLREHFPDRSFLLADEISGLIVSKEQVEAHDFVIIPPWYKLEGIAIDLFINTRSFMEMNREAIEKYFYLIHSTIASEGFLFNINRYSKNTVGYPIRFWEYPYDEKWKVIFSEPSWRQSHIHQLITQRARGRGDVKEELRRIEDLERGRQRENRAKRIRKKITCTAVSILKAVLPSRVYKRCRDCTTRAVK